MSKKLIAVHSIQTTDEKGNRVDVAPGEEFTVQTAEEGAELIAKGAAKDAKAVKPAKAETETKADEPSKPAGNKPQGT